MSTPEKLPSERGPIEEEEPFEGPPEEPTEELSNLIEEFVSIARGGCDSPLVYVEAGAYHLISHTMGQFMRVTGATCKRPNSWIILSSIPGRMRRSSIASYVTRVYKRAMKKIVFQTMLYDALGTEAERLKTAEKIVEISIIEEGSVEGIMDHIMNAYEEYGLKSFSIMSTEFGAVLQKMQGTHYEAGVPALLSKLKYGESGVVYLSARTGKTSKRYIPSGLYITLFAGMQEPEQYLTKRQSRTGLLRRLNIVLVTPEDLSMDDWKSPISFDRDAVPTKLDAFADKLADAAIELYNKRYFTESPDDDPKVPAYFLEFPQLNKIAREIDEKLTHADFSEYDLYRQGTVEQLAELSVIHAIACDKVVGEEGNWTIIIKEEDFEGAQRLHNEMHKHAEEILDSLSVSSRPMETQQDTIDRIYNIMRRGGRTGIGRSDLFQQSKLKKVDLDEYINTLWESAKILCMTKKTGGRFAIRYYAAEFFTEEEARTMTGGTAP